MAASLKQRPQAAQVEPAKKAAKLKADKEAEKARPAWQQQKPASPFETPLPPEPERISAAHRSQGPPTWLPDPLVARRYGVNPRTIRRWDEDKTLDFPAVIFIHGRRYRELRALEEWERRTAAQARSMKARRLEEEHSAVEAT